MIRRAALFHPSSLIPHPLTNGGLMELMQLEMFVAMVEEGNFHKAAEKVFRTQPAVSMALRKLEREIGSPLFDRSSRNAYVLTDTGVVLYEHARRLLNLRDETIVALEELHSLQTGRIRLGANESASLFLLPRLILAFREKYPKIKIEVIRQLSERLPYELRQRNLDFAILSFQPEEGDLERNYNDELVRLEPVSRLKDLRTLRQFVNRHYILTGSPRARSVLRCWSKFWPQFRKVVVRDAGVEPSEADTLAEIEVSLPPRVKTAEAAALAEG